MCHKILRKHLFLSAIQLLRIRSHNSFVLKQAHSTWHYFSPFRILFFNRLQYNYWHQCWQELHAALYTNNVFITHNCVLMNLAHNNFSDMDSKLPTGCIQHGIFAFVLKDIFIVSFQHIIIYGKLYCYFKEIMGKLTVYLNTLSLQMFGQRISVPNICNNKSNICMSRIWRKIINYLNQ